METTVLSIDLIVSNPKVRNGRPVIEGTSLRVQDVAAAYTLRNETTEEITKNYGISPGQVHAALAYYYEHQDSIDAQMRADDEYIQQAKEKGIGQSNKPLSG